ncbi:MAG TPA: AI-2E family transporter [Vicinamibacterales bacterium]|nr:AI-2E family transporter [Vicinamibacterales bacterium]
MATEEPTPGGTDLRDVAKTVVDEREPPPPQPVPLDVRSLALTVIAALMLLAALHLLSPVLIPLAFAILISYALTPIVSSLVRLRVPRAVAATVVLTAVLGGAAWLAYAMTDDVAAVAARLPTAAEKMRQTVREFRQSGGAAGPVEQVQKAAETLETAAAEATGASPAAVMRARERADEGAVVDLRGWLMAGSTRLAGMGAQAVIVFFLALYLLAAGDLFKRKTVRIMGTTLSEKKITVQILDEIDRQIATFLLVRLGITVLVAVLTWIPLRAIGLEQAALWGVAAGVLNIVPYIGPVIVAVVVFIVGFVQFGTLGMAALASGLTVVVTSVEGYWLTPWLTSRAAQMNAVAIFVGLLFWGWLWGLAGVLLAVPMMLALKAISDRVEELKGLGELLGE